MKTSKITLSIAAIMVAMAFSVTSCKKDKTETTEDKDTGSASDNSLAEKSADDITNIGGQAAEDNSLNAYRYGDAFISSCATVVRDSVMKTITVTFNGQQCLDGHIRSGSLLFDYSASTNGAKYYRDPGFALTVTSTNYIVDGNQINIVNKSVQNTTAPGFNPATTNLTWSVNTNINVVKASSGGTVSWSANKVKTLMNTSDTNVYRGPSQHIVWSKAIIGITGNASGTTANGDSFSAATTSQLIRDMNCSPNSNFPGHHPFIQGTLDFTHGTKPVRHFDYGNGVCDDQATVTINGNTYTITLK